MLVCVCVCVCGVKRLPLLTSLLCDLPLHSFSKILIKMFFSLRIAFIAFKETALSLLRSRVVLEIFGI